MTAAELAWGESGLLPVVIQDAATGDVLTLAHANREALDRTIAERTTWLYSRSRKALWKKGETSGNVQDVLSVAYDCDADALLYRVRPHGPACHTGARTCFNDTLLAPAQTSANGDATFEHAIVHVRETVASRRTADPEHSYTAKLLGGGIDRILKKIGEEATEVVIAAKNGVREEIVWETADLLYHTIVMLEERGVALDDVGAELLRRAK